MTKEQTEKKPKTVFRIRVTAKELKNRHIMEWALKFIDVKIRQQALPYVMITRDEFDILKKNNPSFLVPKERYNNKTTYKNEIGKYVGKRLIVKG